MSLKKVIKEQLEKIKMNQPTKIKTNGFLVRLQLESEMKEYLETTEDCIFMVKEYFDYDVERDLKNFIVTKNGKNVMVVGEQGLKRFALNLFKSKFDI